MLFTAHNLNHEFHGIVLRLRACCWMLLIVLSPAPFFGQADLMPPSVKLATRQFKSPETGAYLEVQVEFLATGVTWLDSPDTTYRAGVTWTVVAYDSTGTVAGYGKSTARTGELTVPDDFIDVIRIPLKAGPHVMELEVEDLGNLDRPVLKYETVVSVDAGETMRISDLLVVQGVGPASDPPTSLTRSGRDILPLVDQRVSADVEHLLVYAELYGMSDLFGAGEPFLAVAGFRALGSEAEWVEGTQRFFRLKAAEVMPMLEAVPVPGPGLYELVVQVMTPDQALLASSGLTLDLVSAEAQDAAVAAEMLSPFVQKYQDRDSLYGWIETLIPIADAGERRSIEYVLKEAELRSLQSFLDQFWLERNPSAPESAWLEYLREVEVANEAYGACPNREGHETDMGWILLRYGRPNTVVQRHHGTQYYPYEIWHYHKAGQFNNRRFLFYTPQVVGECFELLHSDHPQELRNADWLDILKTRELGHSVVETGMNQLGRRDTYSREEPEDLFFNPR